MNRKRLGAFNIHYQNAAVERIDTIMVLLVLLSRRKEKGGKWQGTYADFNRGFPWGGLSRKEGEAYLDETLGELAGKGCLSFDKSRCLPQADPNSAYYSHTKNEPAHKRSTSRSTSRQ